MFYFSEGVLNESVLFRGQFKLFLRVNDIVVSIHGSSGLGVCKMLRKNECCLIDKQRGNSAHVCTQVSKYQVGVTMAMAKRPSVASI